MQILNIKAMFINLFYKYYLIHALINNFPKSVIL